MASKAVVTLLATAVALAETVDNAELKDCIEALQFLGDDADGKAQEYKDLKEVVAKIQAEADADDEDTQNVSDEDVVGDGVDDTVNTDEQSDEDVPKKLNYMGIKQIGSLWYSSKDKYKKSFATADECAEHFNK